MPQFVTVKICSSIEEAELLQELLTGEGIESFLRDTHVAAVYGQGVVGGCRLQVRTEQEEIARQHLESFEKSQDNPTRPDHVFRVRSTDAATYAFYSSLFVALIIVLGNLLVPTHKHLTFLSCVTVFGTALVLGSRRRSDYCATCRATLPEATESCASCGGKVVGEINHPKERLAALEEYEFRVRR